MFVASGSSNPMSAETDCSATTTLLPVPLALATVETIGNSSALKSDG